MEVGVRYFERILRRFPTIHALARAPESEILRLWSGLGYYRRARNLHRTARLIVKEHGGHIPDDSRVLKTFPGIGPYTAGAIASIAYDRPAPALDGNQVRVLGRFLGTRDATRLRSRKRIERWMGGLLTAGSPRLLNQALMDLGSQVCTPRTPRCHACPLAAGCRTKGEPPRARRRATRPTSAEDWEALIVRRGDRIWLAAPKATGLLAGLWLPPLRRVKHREPPDRVQVFSHRTWRVRFVEAPKPSTRRGRWVAPAELRRIPHGAVTKAALAWARDRRRPYGGRISCPV